MSRNIEFVYFDLGNVVFEFSGGLEEIANRYSRQLSDVKSIWSRYDDEVCRGNMTPQQLWGKYQSQLNLQNDQLDFAEFWTDHFEPILETIQLIGALEKAEVPIGVLSNIYPGIFELVAKKSIIPSFKWKSKVLSCEIGSVKPEENIYKIAEERSGKLSENILLIDDNQTFLSTATSRGWQTYQFNPLSRNESVRDVKSLLKM